MTMYTKLNIEFTHNKHIDMDIFDIVDEFGPSIKLTIIDNVFRCSLCLNYGRNGAFLLLKRLEEFIDPISVSVGTIQKIGHINSESIPRYDDGAIYIFKDKIFVVYTEDDSVYGHASTAYLISGTNDIFKKYTHSGIDNEENLLVFLATHYRSKQIGDDKVDGKSVNKGFN
jgi:hypothetical protein